MAVKKIAFTDSASTNVFVNQGVEAALFETVADDEARLYLWSNDNTVVVGRNQHAAAECNVTLLESEGGLLARRLSGGGAVYHDAGNLNFTFIAKTANFDKRKNFDIVCDALSKLGINAEISGRNDLTANGAKFSGNAYYKRGDTELHHGTLIIGTSADKIARYLTPSESKFAGKAVRSVRSRVCALNEINPLLTRETLAAALCESFRRAYPDAESAELQPFFLGADVIMKWTAFFGTDEWRYGKKAEFNLRAETELFSRPAVVRAEEKDGVLVTVAVDTDMLDGDKACAVRELLTGAKFGKTPCWEARYDALADAGIDVAFGDKEQITGETDKAFAALGKEYYAL